MRRLPQQSDPRSSSSERSPAPSAASRRSAGLPSASSSRSALSGGVLAVLGGLAYLELRQTDAQKAAAAHTEAIAALDKAIQDVKNGVPGAVAKLQALSNAELNTAEAALKSAEAQVAVRQKVLDAITSSPGHTLGVPLLERALGPQNEANVRLAAAKKTLQDAQAAIAETRAKIAEGAQAVDASLAGSTDAAASSIQKTAESAGKVVHVFTEAGVAAYDTGKSIADSSKAAQAQLDAQAKAAGKAGKDTSQALDGIVHASDDLKKAQSPGEFAARGVDDAKAKVADLKTTIATIPDAVSKAASSIGAPAPQQGQQQGQQAPTGLAAAFDTAEQQIASTAQKIVTDLDGVKTSASTLFDGLAGDAETAASGITQAFAGLADTVNSVFTSIVSGLQTQFAALKSSVTSLVSSLQAQLEGLRSAISSASSAASGGGGGGFAGGGAVFGAGSKTSDSIFARLSNGEFVIRAAAVDKYGLGTFSMLNSMRLPADLFKGFNIGGFVDGLTAGMAVPVPAFAKGGLAVPAPAAAGRPVNFHLDGKKYTFLDPGDVSEALIRDQRSKAPRRSGRAPSWYRG